MSAIKPGVVALLFLAACSTPQERCVRDATRDIRTVDALIAETEVNLTRGYRIVTETDVRPYLTFCSGVYRHHHSGVRFCTQQEVVKRSRPVAIDPAAERRKLASLRQRKAALQAPTRRALAACTG